MYTLKIKPHDPERPAEIIFKEAEQVHFVKDVIKSIDAKTIFDIEILQDGKLIESVTIKPPTDETY